MIRCPWKIDWLQSIPVTCFFYEDISCSKKGLPIDMRPVKTNQTKTAKNDGWYDTFFKIIECLADIIWYLIWWFQSIWILLQLFQNGMVWYHRRPAGMRGFPADDGQNVEYKKHHIPTKLSHRSLPRSTPVLSWKKHHCKLCTASTYFDVKSQKPLGNSW